MKTKALFFFFLLPLICNGQGWERSYVNQQAGGYNMVQTLDGGFALTGYASNNEEGANILILRLDAEGNQQWLTEIEVDSSGSGTDIIETPDLGLIVIGSLIGESSTIRKNFATKVDACGNFQWIKIISDELEVYSYVYSIVANQNDEYIIVGYADFEDSQYPKAVKINGAGDVIWSRVYDDILPFDDSFGAAIIPAIDQNFLISGGMDNYSGFVLKIDPAGTPLWVNTYEEMLARDIVQTEEGNILIVGDNKIIKTNDTGEEIWRKLLPLDIFIDGFIHQADEGGFVVALPLFELFDGTGFSNIQLLKLNDEGDVEWDRVYGVDNIDEFIGGGFEKTVDGGYIFAGTRFAGNKYVYVLKVTNRGDLYTNQVNGRIAVDLNLNCTVEEQEPDVNSGWLVEFVGEQTFYTIANDTGEYSIELDTGSYQVNLYHTANIWQNCDLPPLTLHNFHQTTTLDIPVQNIEACAWLEVDVATPFLRRCSHNTYDVTYCNNGLTLTQDVSIEVLLDPEMSYFSSTIDLANQEDQLLSFDIGTVAPGECGSFKIVAYLGCNSTQLGQSHCVEARIYPNTSCEIWEGPNMEVTGSCESDTVFFTIKNVGDDMATAEDYQVIKNDYIILQMPYQLDAQETLEVAVPVTNSATYRLEAAQVDGFPATLGNPIASASVEGCDGLSIGYVTIFPEDDGEPYLAIDCRQNIGSYDPNDKQAFPEGLGEAHYIRPGTGLEYQIRFQNTGTDTAFTVVIRDTLSAALDISSFRPGTGSHSYDYEIYGNGILKFTFKDILLPDSNANEAASHGFIKFRISPKSSLELGSVIGNRAGIYFDFNAPVITNETWHTLGEDFMEVVSTTSDFETIHSIQVIPNPTRGNVLLKMDGHTFSGEQFNLYAPTGQLVFQQKLYDNQLNLELNKLAAGLYFYQIESKDSLIGTGKLIIH